MARSISEMTRRVLSAALALTAGASGLVGLRERPALATAAVTSVTGSAFGYWADEIRLFGGAQPDVGPVPSVALAPNASDSPRAATAPTGRVAYGPATIFTSGVVDVSTSGGLGPTGSVTTSVDINDVNASRLEIFGEDNYDCCDLRGDYTNAPVPRPLTDIASTCTASQTGVSATTTITNGWLYLDNGYSDYDLIYPEPPELTAPGPAEHNPVKVAIPTNPAPGTTYTGHIHINDVIDYYTVIFNEQVSNPDGSLTVNAVHEIFGTDPPGNTSNLKGHLFLGQSLCGVAAGTVPPAAGPPAPDFDGDNDTDRSVFRDGAWYAEDQAPAYFGIAGDIAVPGDYDGDSTTDRAVYRQGAWFTDGQAPVYLGLGDDVPVPGDYDGDGDTDRAVFRPSVGAWYVEGQAPIYHGAEGDIPVPGDYDGDGATEVGVWRPSVGGWYVEGQPVVFLGLSGDIPVPGDYGGDATTDRGIWRPSVGGWYVEGQAQVFLGLDGDVPVPGDYDGNGTADRAIWRPEAGGWYVDGQVTTFLGLAGDIPLPLPQAIYRAFFGGPPTTN